MSLVRVQTVWTGITGAPYYTNLYAIGPLTTNNGNDLATAWRAFLFSLVPTLANGMIANIDPELLEFNEADGVVTSAGSTVQAPVLFGSGGDHLPHSQQGLVQWSTNGIVHNRRVRGRTFIPGGTELANSPAGLPTSAIDTPLQTAVDTLLSTMSGRMRIWSRPLNQDPPDPKNPNRPGSAHPITGGNVASYWAILRSRRD